MKKLTLLVLGLVAGFIASAQQFVSTEPSNRNVVIEEFTGRGCGYCPLGHHAGNVIMNNNPGRAWAVNIHAGGYALTSYPNFITTIGNTIHSGFSISGYPTGIVNRLFTTCTDYTSWNSYTNQQLAQQSEVNIGGQVVINPETREATVTVEAYYTANSSTATNYLTIYMLQDSILGSQSDYSSGHTYCPEQWTGTTYRHMHILRAAINSSAWGDEVAPTTAGTLITKEYTYQIPEIIGSPNGVEVDLDDIHFIAFICENTSGARKVLSANSLNVTFGSSEPIFPVVNVVNQVNRASCSQEKSFKFTMLNGGTETLNSIMYSVNVAGVVQEYEWNGVLDPKNVEDISFDMEIPFGTNPAELNIARANDQPYEYKVEFTAKCDQWIEKVVDGETATVKIYINQDQYGEQTTWKLINSLDEIVASGGPYNHIATVGQTQLHVENLGGLPVDECYMFIIDDENSNGICCAYGDGYYKIRVNGEFIVGEDEDNGEFGAQATALINLKKSDASVDENAAESYKIYPNPANSTIFVEGENVKTVVVYNSIGQKVTAVEGSAKTTVDVASFADGVYFVKVIATDGTVKTQKISIVR